MTESEPLSVLVVDDDADIQSLIEFVLMSAGYNVRTASDGLEALQAVEACCPSLILLDMKMPVMNGWEFARALHARGGPSVPIVVVTASADARKVAAEIGAVGWLAKPFDLDDLLRQVSSHSAILAKSASA